MHNALALCQSDQVHREEPKIYSRLKVMVSGVLEDQQQHSFLSPKQKEAGCTSEKRR